MTERIINLRKIIDKLDETSKGNDSQELMNLLNQIEELTNSMKKEVSEKTSQANLNKKNNFTVKSIIASLEDLHHKVIHRVESKNKYKPKHLPPSKLQLLKQKIKFKENTVGFKKIMQNAHKRVLNVENKSLEGMVNLKENINNRKTKFINKMDLSKKYIKTKISKNKNVIKKVSKEKLNNFKMKMKDIGLTVTTQLGARSLYAIESIEDKMLFIKDKIQTKVHSKKNIITHKTGMEIALFKDKLKQKRQKRVEKKIEKMDSKIENNKQEIELLKEQRRQLFAELFNHNNEFASEGIKTR